jgi:hypothetical protein
MITFLQWVLGAMAMGAIAYIIGWVVDHHLLGNKDR